METCFEFDTSKSEPVSYDMEVSTDDTERKEQIVYIKKKKNNDFAVLDIPPGTYLLTHSLICTHLLAQSDSIVMHIPQDIDSVKHLLTDGLPRCGALLSVFIRKHNKSEKGVWETGRVLRGSTDRRNSTKKSIRFRLINGVIMDSFFPNPDIRIVCGVYSSVTVNEDIGATCLSQSERSNVLVQQLLSIDDADPTLEQDDSDSDDSSVGAPLLDDEEIDEIGIDIYSLVADDNSNTLPLYSNSTTNATTTDIGSHGTVVDDDIDTHAKEILFDQHCQEIDDYLDRYCSTVRIKLDDDDCNTKICMNKAHEHVSFVPIRG